MKILGAELVASAAGPEGFPPEGPVEVALLGRSNVGKSSLLNRLVGRRRLAYTSKSPGKTRLLHFYAVRRPGREIRLVDLPGYGFARVARAERRQWKQLVESYLDARASLRVAVLLQDLRRDVSADETELLAWLEQRNLTTLVALTKTDKLPRMRRQQRLSALAEQLPLPAERVLATSAQTGEGIDALWQALDAAIG